MEKWVCDVCGYIYDPEIGDPDNGIAAGTAFAEEKAAAVLGCGRQGNEEDNDKDNVCVPWQYLPFDDGGVCDEGYGR